MAEEEEEQQQQELLRLTFLYRGKSIQLAALRNWSLQRLGEQVALATGIAPHTLKLLPPQSGRPALRPLCDGDGDDAGLTVHDCGLDRGKAIRVLGTPLDELVRAPGKNDRVRGFEEEEAVARRRRLAPVSGGVKLPQGEYVFAEFKPLQFRGQVHPSPSKALELMHVLASDPGVVPVMNKHRWRVGAMTEMPPEGLVGISPECLLGYNRNRGQEISLRLRTDDLRGFRKYESIKRTLLHELAHMVHDEHDENFYRLDRQLIKEVVELDWTKGKSNTLRRDKRVEAAVVDDEPDVTHGSQRLGGSTLPALVDARTAARVAALNRYQRGVANSEEMTEAPAAAEAKKEPDPDEAVEVVKKEPDPDDEEPDPDDAREEPDPDDAKEEPDPDDAKEEPDPDDDEPDPDDDKEEPVEVAKAEPDPDDASEASKAEELPKFKEPDPDDETMGEKNASVSGPGLMDVEQQHEAKLDSDCELQRIADATTNANSRLRMSLMKLKAEAGPSDVATACQTLFTILRNIMEHPYDDKYRLLRKTNPTFQQRVARHQAAVELLQLVGFVYEAEKDAFVLKRSDPALIWLARNAIASLEGVMA